jgi:uncharacterized protein YfkK (UPF0435 family)
LLIYLAFGLLLQNIKLTIFKYLNNKKNIREIFFDINSKLFIINIFYYKNQKLNKKKVSNIRYIYINISKILLLFIILINLFIN